MNFDIEQEIIKLTKPKTIAISDCKHNGLYTWKGNVYCLSEGYDYAFVDLSEKDQKEIYKCILEKKFAKNKSVC